MDKRLCAPEHENEVEAKNACTCERSFGTNICYAFRTLSLALART